MKIHFDGVNFASQTGPNTFAKRLAMKLLEMGHDVVEKGVDGDVSLVLIERTGQPLAKKVVQRLDGIWFKPGESHKNDPIQRLYHESDAIVWQSSFDKEMSTKWFGRPFKATTTAVIHNGIELNPLKELTIPSLMKMRQDYAKMYVCSANWHPQKRLRDNVRLFNNLRKSEPSSCLIILGNNPDVMVADKDIFYAGPQPESAYMEVYSACDWMLHLAWADHCPNVVVEALSQGTPVVCSSVGGTKELVGEYGYVIQDEPYNFGPYDYESPPAINLEGISELTSRHSLAYDGITNLIDMNVTYKKYVEVFESIVA